MRVWNSSQKYTGLISFLSVGDIACAISLHIAYSKHLCVWLEIYEKKGFPQFFHFPRIVDFQILRRWANSPFNNIRHTGVFKLVSGKSSFKYVFKWVDRGIFNTDVVGFRTTADNAFIYSLKKNIAPYVIDLHTSVITEHLMENIDFLLNAMEKYRPTHKNCYDKYLKLKLVQVNYILRKSALKN